MVPRSLLPVLLIALVPRVVLAWLPGVGRDEAAYHWWSHHPEPAYAPLLQLFLALADRLPLDPALALRIPNLLAGAAALVLFGRLVTLRGESRPAWAVAALAATPWALYTGGLAHPDPFLVCALLAFALADRAGHPGAIGLATLLAVAAKPSGLLVVPFALWRLHQLRGGPAWAVGVTAVALAAASMALFSPAMVVAILQFARVDAEAGWVARVGVGLVSTLALGGLVLPAAAARGFQPRDTTRALGIGYVVAFALAALATGQIKGNWILPGLLLLWPEGGLPRPRLWTPAVVASAAVSVGLVTVMHRPDLAGALEARIPGLDRTYPLQAGAREMQVSATTTWAERFREYGDLSPFADAVATDAARPGWIVSDDYGLATQLSFAWSHGRIPVVLPEDPIFLRSVAAAEPMGPADGILLMAVHDDPASLVASLGRSWRMLDRPPVPHPVTGQPVRLAWVAREEN